MTKDLNPLGNETASEEGVPVSVRIRERLLASRKRFNANDNIADFIEPGELDHLLSEVTQKMQGVLDSLVIDTTHDHNTDDTARRVAKMYLNEVFNGRYVHAPKITEFPNAEHLNELMIVGPITVRSACSHHFCPVIGKVWIGVMPNEHTNVIGLSKYARLAEWVMGRPQIQDEAVVQFAQLTIAAIAGDVDSAKTAEIEATLRSDDACMALSDRSAVRGKEPRKLRHCAKVWRGSCRAVGDSCPAATVQ